MITAPSEIRKATLMLPSAGGLSGLGASGVALSSSPAAIHRVEKSGNAATHPSAAPPLKRALRFMIGSFRVSSPACLNWLSRTCQRLRDCQRNPAPAFRLAFQLPASHFGNAIVLGPAVVFRFPPRGCNPTFFLHAVQRGKQRTGFHLKRSAGDLLYSPCNSQSMHLLKRE